MVRLPIEIHEHIIGCLGNRLDSAGDYARCARVCRAWLPYSRFNLYSDLIFWHRQQWMVFKDRALFTADRTIQQYLGRARTLSVWLSPERKPGTDSERGEERPWAHLVLLICAAHLSGLTFISLAGVDWSTSHDLALSIGHVYRSVTVLHLTNCTFKSILQLHKLVTAFPALAELSLRNTTLRSQVFPLHISTVILPLKHLQLFCENDVAPTIMQWLLSILPTRSLNHLTWLTRRYNCEEVPEEAIAFEAITGFLRGSSLEELYCRLPRTCEGPIISPRNRFTVYSTSDLVVLL